MKKNDMAGRKRGRGAEQKVAKIKVQRASKIPKVPKAAKARGVEQKAMEFGARELNTLEAVVGRAEWKLADAVKAFAYDFRGKTVLDVGSSTGGFTELALRLGAIKVIAVEKGTRQMKAPLRFDERLDLHEKTDVFDVLGINKAGELVQKQGEDVVELVTPLQVDTVMADVSFVSLRNILVHVKRIVARKADYLVMLKPQFEAKEWQLNRGVVKNERMRREILGNFEEWVRRNGFVVIKKRDNTLVGKKGNQERFYWLRSVG